MDGFGEFGLASHPVAVAADVDDVAAVEQPVQLRRRNPDLTAHLADVLATEQPHHDLQRPPRSSASVDPQPLSDCPTSSNPLSPKPVGSIFAKQVSRKTGGAIPARKKTSHKGGQNRSMNSDLGEAGCQVNTVLVHPG